MKKNKEIQKELEELSSPLAGMKKENGFKVPKDYFKSLPDEIMEKVKPPLENVSKGTSWIDDCIHSLSLLFQPRVIGALASIALLLVATFYFSQSGDENTVLAVDDFSTEEAQLYLAENLDEFEDDLIFGLEIGGDELDFFPDLEVEDDEASDQMLDDLLEDLDDELLEELL